MNDIEFMKCLGASLRSANSVDLVVLLKEVERRYNADTLMAADRHGAFKSDHNVNSRPNVNGVNADVNVDVNAPKHGTPEYYAAKMREKRARDKLAAASAAKPAE